MGNEFGLGCVHLFQCLILSDMPSAAGLQAPRNSIWELGAFILASWGIRHGRSNSNRLRQGDRNCLAWFFENNTAPADACGVEPARFRWNARHGRSSRFGCAGAPEIAARARSLPLGRRRSTRQDHECLQRSTQRRTFSCVVCMGPHRCMYIYIYICVCIYIHTYIYNIWILS